MEDSLTGLIINESKDPWAYRFFKSVCAALLTYLLTILFSAIWPYAVTLDRFWTLMAPIALCATISWELVQRGTRLITNRRAGRD